MAAEAIVKGATGARLGTADVYYNRVLDRALASNAGRSPNRATNPGNVLDPLTPFTGMTREEIDNASYSLAEGIQFVKGLIDSKTIIVGQAVRNDIDIEYNFPIPLLISLDFRPEFGGSGYYKNNYGSDVALSLRYQFN